jgi:hypothetical protein
MSSPTNDKGKAPVKSKEDEVDEKEAKATIDALEREAREFDKVKFHAAPCPRF